MVKESDYKINDLYQGGYSTLDSGYSPNDLSTGYQLPAHQLGTTTNPKISNQIAEVSKVLNQGVINIEMGAISPDVFDQIPKQHFKEINRMAKLAGSDISVHAPIIEASGIGKEGWNESARQLAEKQFIDVIDRTAPMNEKGGMSITIHGSGSLPGTTYKIDEKGNKVVESIPIINRETGVITPLVKEETKFYPSTTDWEKGTINSPEKQIKMINHTEWDNQISQLVHHKEDADARIKDSISRLKPETLYGLMSGRCKFKDIEPIEQQAYGRFNAAQQFMVDASASLSGLFNKAYKFGSDEDKKELRKAAKEYQEGIPQAPIKGREHQFYFDQLSANSFELQKMLIKLNKLNPETHQSVDEFALEKSASTFANVALYAAKKYGDKAPKINIENLYPGMAFSYGKEMDQLIKTTRNKFVEKAISQGLSKSKAEKQAESIIGITFDVGHLNIAKKQGFKDEDLMKELEQMAKHVKHVHLTDNFGYGDSHLIPGMGNVPIKEMMERMEKEGYEGKKIVEAGGFIEQFGGASPFPYMLESFSSPIYQEGPQWNQTPSLYQGYSGGFGQMLPSINYETFGAGFARLPSELGGSNQAGAGNRMSGRGME